MWQKKKKSNICAVSWGRRIRFATNVLDVIERGVTGSNLAFKHLLIGLSEVLRQEGVDDRVDWWIAVRQAVCSHPQYKGGLV